MKGLVSRGLVSAVLVIGTLMGSAVAASAKQPGITGVTFSGTAGSGAASPTMTVTGTGFGAPPVGTPNGNTICGSYVNNGDVFANKLYFMDDGNFEAGYPSNCVGIIIDSWTKTKVVLSFGSAYGTFAHWYLSNGDSYAISIKSGIWGGTVSGLS
jgi:hypothetical protein